MKRLILLAICFLLAAPCFAQLSGTSPELSFIENDQSDALGRWRIIVTGDTFQIQKNSAAGRDYSTYITPLSVSATGAFTLLGLTINSANATGVTTATGLVLNANSLTTGTGFYLASSSLTSGKLFDLQVSGTAGATNQTGININMAGANAAAAQTTYGLKAANVHTGTSVNVGGYFTASGGSTNYAIQIGAGSLALPSAGVIDFNAGDVTVAHSAGQLASTGNLLVTGANSAFGTAATIGANVGFDVAGTMTGVTPRAFRVNKTLTTSTGSTSAYLSMLTGSVTTYAEAQVYTGIATVFVNEPAITLGGGTSATRAASLWISGAPTEGVANHALYVAAGDVTFESTLSQVGLATFSVGIVPATTGVGDIGTAALPFHDIFLAGSSAAPATINYQITGTPTTGLRVVTLPDASFTVAGTALLLGGTNAALTAVDGGVVYSSDTAMAISAAGSSGQLFRSDGTNAPGWTTATYPAVATGTGTILRADGTNWVATTATYPATTTANQILYSSATSVVGEITTGNSGVLVTSAGGVPSIATDIPTAVTIGSGYIYRAGGTDVPILDGGTGASLTAVDGGVLYSTDTVMAISAAGSMGQIFQSAGTGIPVWTTATFPATATGTGTILRADGTNWAATTATYPATVAAGDLLHASGANVIGGITAVAAGQVLVSAGVSTAPAWSASPSISALTLAGILTLNSAVTTGTTTTSGMVFLGNSLTTGTGIYAASSSLTSGKLVNLVVTGTAAAASQTVLNITTSGANASSAITTYGSFVSNTHTGTTSTNIGGHFIASGGATASTALDIGVVSGTAVTNTGLNIAAGTGTGTTSYGANIAGPSGAATTNYTLYLGAPAGAGTNIGLYNAGTSTLVGATTFGGALLNDVAGSDDIGSATLPFQDLYLAGSSGTPGTNNFLITGASTSGTRTITLPDASVTMNAAADISGTTLAAAVVTSSLTTVGTVATGTWNSTLSTAILGAIGNATRVRGSKGTPASLGEGDWWVECSGTTPSAVCSINVYADSATRVIAQVVY